MSKRLLFLAHFHLCSELYLEVDMEKIDDLKRLQCQEKKQPSFNMGSICGNLVKSIGTFRKFYPRT